MNVLEVRGVVEFVGDPVRRSGMLERLALRTQQSLLAKSFGGRHPA